MQPLTLTTMTFHPDPYEAIWPLTLNMTCYVIFPRNCSFTDYDNSPELWPDDLVGPHIGNDDIWGEVESAIEI